MFSNVIQPVQRRIRAFGRELKARTFFLTTDLKHLNYFVLFIGNPRSGTTLIRTLLDAHPNIVIGNEVNVLQLLKAGENWNSVAGKILENADRFSKDPIWTGYSYQIKNFSTKKDSIKVAGDKKAGFSTKLLMEEPDLLSKLIQSLPVPVYVIHCVRHPCDVIATKTCRNKQSLEFNCNHYFSLEKTAAHLSSLIDSKQYKCIYYEDLILNPIQVLKNILNSLDLTAEPEYFKACLELIYDKPNQSRFKVSWTEELLTVVEREILDCEHLFYYLNQGKLTL